MKRAIRAALALLTLCVASTGFAAPWMHVTVFDAAGRVAFKGATGPGGTFSTPALGAGRYVVQFNAVNTAVKGQDYALVISSGRKKTVADLVAGEKFLGGGVAMRIEVSSAMQIKGQISGGITSRVDATTGKRLVWLPPQIGSNLPGRWVPEDSAEAVSYHNSGEIRIEDVRKWQDHGDSPH